MTPYRARLLLAALAVSAVVAAVFLAMRPSAPPPEKLVLGVSPGVFSLLPSVAEKQGFFAAEGLDVTLRSYGLGLAALTALQDGEVEVATAADVAVAIRGMERSDLRILASIATSTDVAVLGRRDMGVSSPRDLVGERVGVPRDSTGDHFLSSFTAVNDIPAEAVERVNLPPDEAINALAEGRLKIAVAWNHHVFDARSRLGDKLVIWPARADQQFYWLLVSDERTVSNRPEAMRRLLRAMKRAEDFARDNPAAAKRISIESLNANPAYVESSWERTKFGLRLDQALITSMEDAAAWRLKIPSGSGAPGAGFPNYFNMIYMDAMDVTSPQSMTVFR